MRAEEVLTALRHNAPYLFLGAAFVAVGMVSAAFAVLRRQRDPLLVCFALFAALYGLLCLAGPFLVAHLVVALWSVGCIISAGQEVRHPWLRRAVKNLAIAVRVSPMHCTTSPTRSLADCAFEFQLLLQEGTFRSIDS